ncbi:MAG: methylglyoxal synthase [Promethearchaeota archaeon]
MTNIKTIALVAHDRKKKDLVEWVKFNRETLKKYKLVATGTTGTVLSKEVGLKVFTFKSGPIGGDSQIGCRIVEGNIDILIFFWDPLENQPHDPDIKALLRLSVVWNIPTACNRATADFILSSPLMDTQYERLLSDVKEYTRERKIEYQ